MPRLVHALALACLACGPAPVAPADPPRTPGGDVLVAEAPDALSDVPGRAPTAAEERAIGALMRTAERLRDLTFVRPVPFRIQNREVITEFVRSKLEPEELERSRVFYVALGLLDPSVDVQDLLIRVLGEQIVGYYDPERGLMVIRDDVARQLERATHVGRELGEAEMVIVHELVHALQDQRLALGERYEEERSIDADNAFASLVEGDATLAMIGHMAARAGQPLRRLTRNAAMLRALVRSNPQALAGQEIERAPPIVRLPLMSRYLDGMVFCATLHGARGWAGVDEAHARPPVSTEQVLHPERYLAGERPVDVALPELPALAEAGYAPHEEDSLGELETSIWFGLGDGSDRAEAAAEGWGGDRLRVYRNAAGETAVVWFSVWDDATEAQEAEAAARAVARRTARADSQLVERIDRALLIVRDLPPALHGAVRAEFAAFARAFAP